MKEYFVMWTYQTNYSGLLRVHAEGPLEAAQHFVGHYGEDFKRRASIYVFDTAPALMLQANPTGQPII